MKRTFIAAAALLLGTSALTAASAAQDKFHKDSALASKMIFSADPRNESIIAMKTSAAAAKAGVALAGMGGALEEVDQPALVAKPLAQVENDPIILAKLQEAAAMKAARVSGMGGPLEEVDSAVDTDKWESGKVETDPIILAKWDQAAAIKAQTVTGMGGPLEAADAGMTDLAGRPAADNYPPCSPGPGDDRCIQLYEPGVRAQLASWDRATGGLAGHSVTTAMGGPYEPVDGAANDSQLAMNGDGMLDASLGETSDLEGDIDIAQHNQFAGVGGPIEAQSGYPPCSPGPGDDRCIQLYEPGVSGVGN